MKIEIFTKGIGGVIASGYAWMENRINCPNCADQASIAAPGQTVLCKTHADEKHYADMKEFFDSQLSSLTIQTHMPFCSRCGKNDPDYIGVIQDAFTLTSFSFCIDCRDELTLKKNAALAASERIGA